jgi:hypothetical protein
MELPLLLSTAYALFVAALMAPRGERLGKRLLGGATAGPAPVGRVRGVGLATGGMLALPPVILLPLLGLPAWAGLLVFPLGYVAAVSRYAGGWSRGGLAAMERELPGLTAFVLALAGMGDVPVPTALSIYAERFPRRPLASLARRAPSGEDPVAFLLSLGIPSVPVGGALSVLSRAQGSPRRREVLERLHRAQERRVRLELERIVEGRVAASPLATVLLLFPALLATALIPVVVRFLALLGAM